MSKKILFSSLFILLSSLSAWGVDIVSREDWGADPEYVFSDSAVWQSILDRSDGYTPNRRQILIHEHLTSTYPSFFYLSEPVYSWMGRSLATPLRRIPDVRRIIIHHTAQRSGLDSRSEEQIVREIYRYHAITNRWGDIGYNYIIGPSGTIYEGRLGGGNARAFHTRWNNEHSIGIALMGDFDHEKPTHLQILSMVRLIDHAIREFDIPLDPDIPVFRECQNCTNYTEAVRRPWLIGHHHAGNTSCPGEYLEGWIEPLRQYFEQSHSH